MDTSKKKNMMKMYDDISEILNHCFDAIIWFDSQFTVLFCNNAAEEMLEIDKQSATGRNILELFADCKCSLPFSEKDFYQIKPKKTVIAKTVEKRFAVFEWQIVAHKKSDEITSRETMTLIGHKKEPYSDNLAASNLGAILDCIPGSLYWKDLDGIYLGCNKFMADTAGFKSVDEIIGKTDFELWPDNAEKIRENDLQVTASGETTFLEEIVRIKNGREMHFTGVKMPLRNREEKIIGIVANSLDITKQKETEMALSQAKEQAEAAGILKEEFIRNMEHDIRTPCAGIWGMATILLNEEKDPDKKEYLQDLLSCADALLSFCNEILNFSMVKNAALPIVSREIDIDKLFDNLIKMETAAAKAKNITLRLEKSDNMPQFLIGDGHRIKRIVVNLISNAIKFTNRGSVTLGVDFIRKNNNSQIGKLKIQIIDTGIGIPEAKQEIIFQSFTRLTPSNKGIYGGQGLGLAIIKQYVSELDGEIQLQSEVNVGSTFTIFIPCRLCQERDADIVSEL